MFKWILAFLIFINILSPGCKKENPQPVFEKSSFTDARDGNSYEIVKIGDKWWMAENLRFLPDDYVPEGSEYSEPYYYIQGYWGEDLTEAKEDSNYTVYGVLYNWTAAKCSCPDGWHLPSDDEWKNMEINLGMKESAANAGGFRGTDQGTKMKSKNGWSGYGSGNNLSGFSALPGGCFSAYYQFTNPGYFGYWWTSTEDEKIYAWARKLYYNHATVERGRYFHDYGFSVRCVKDN